jgi:hypothetical protein
LHNITSKGKINLFEEKKFTPQAHSRPTTPLKKFKYVSRCEQSKFSKLHFPLQPDFKAPCAALYVAPK